MMWRRPEEIAAAREAFRKMDTAHKAEHIYIYYKWFIIIGLILLVILGNGLHRHLTKKNPVLYIGLVNVSVGPELQDEMTLHYLEEAGINTKKNEIMVYSNLVLNSDPTEEDHQYVYASRMKIMATVNSKQLDLVLMSREGYDLLSESGYLMELTGLSPALTPYLTENTVVLESNAIEVQLNTADELRIVTETVVNGLDVSSLDIFRDAGFDGDVYIGVISNTIRTADLIPYLEYLVSAPGTTS